MGEVWESKVGCVEKCGGGVACGKVYWGVGEVA